ncbi:hypothetical protein LX77_01510, partial [Gelidibacter algens]
MEAGSWKLEVGSWKLTIFVNVLYALFWGNLRYLREDFKLLQLSF